MRRWLQLVVLLSVLAWIGGWATGQIREAEIAARNTASGGSDGMLEDVLLRMNKLRERQRSMNGIEGDLLLPYLSLELQTAKSATPGGTPVDTILHEDALLALWDRIVSSIRLRNPDTTSPRSNPRPADPRPPVAP
jgi:hypothetical protein